uniref:Uncharacterized protein n=1 Tax=Arundo donax TaxID=35708 RepID=A0A0A9AK85_ARUDO
MRRTTCTARTSPATGWRCSGSGGSSSRRR